MLDTYTELAERMSTHSLEAAVQDIDAMLRANRQTDPSSDTVRKYWAQWDAYTVELQRRRALAC